jgi:amidase
VRELAFAGPARQAELVRRREVRPRELVELALTRIGELDGTLNAFRVVRAEQALAAADGLVVDDRPLLGVPVAIKDDLAVAGERLTWGTSAVRARAQVEDELVTRLRGAGAIVLGITNVPELTLWGFTETLSNGATRNPWDPGRTPGGSSGGSAAAVAAGLTGLATASDGAGSIRIPAACCGLFGLKLTRDRLGWGARGEVWNGMAVPGVLARTVADTALAYAALTGEAWSPIGAPPARLRVAVSTATPPGIPQRALDREHRDAVLATASLLEGLGHEVHEQALPISLATTRRVAARYFAGAAEAERAVARPDLLERRTRRMAAAGRLAERMLASARAGADADAAAFAPLFAEHDVLLTPAVAGPPAAVGTWQGRGAAVTWQGNAQRYPFSALWNHLGNPAMSVPAGFDTTGLPLAVQIAGRMHDEGRLLALAAQLEEARPWAHARPPVS